MSQRYQGTCGERWSQDSNLCLASVFHCAYLGKVTRTKAKGRKACLRGRHDGCCCGKLRLGIAPTVGICLSRDVCSDAPSDSSPRPLPRPVLNPPLRHEVPGHCTQLLQAGLGKRASEMGGCASWTQTQKETRKGERKRPKDNNLPVISSYVIGGSLYQMCIRVPTNNIPVNDRPHI